MSCSLMNRTHQPETFLTLIIENDRQSSQENDTLPLFQPGKKIIQNVDMRLRFDFFVRCLVERNDGISYYP
jgi:hypothetical protein